MSDDGFVEVHYVGGSNDGLESFLPDEMVVEGAETQMPLRFDVANSEPPAQPTIYAGRLETYVLSRAETGWVATLKP